MPLMTFGKELNTLIFGFSMTLNSESNPPRSYRCQRFHGTPHNSNEEPGNDVSVRIPNVSQLGVERPINQRVGSLSVGKRVFRRGWS